MEIRPIQKQDDRVKVSLVYEESWKSAYKGIIPQSYLDSIPKGKWCNSLDVPGRHTILLLDGERIIGTSSYCASRWDAMKGYGEIISIYILPDYCTKGYGRALLQSAIDGLAEMGFGDIFLYVLEENHIARRFYERFGFVNSGRYLDDYIGGRALREIQYVLHL